MLRFEPNFELNLLHMEIALVLHHASVWGAIADVPVVVVRRKESTLQPGTLRAWSLALDLDTDRRSFDVTEQLFGYLARILPGAYQVRLEENHVHVEYDPRRRPPPLEPAYVSSGSA